MENNAPKRSALPLYGVIYNNHITEIMDEHKQNSLSTRIKDAKKVKSSLAETWKTKNKNVVDDDSEEEMDEHYFNMWDYSLDQVVSDLIELNAEHQNTRFILMRKRDENGYLETSFATSVWFSILLDFVKQTSAVPHVITTASTCNKKCTIEKIIFPDTGNQIVIEDDMDLRKAVCDSFGFPFKNQSKRTIASMFVKHKLARVTPSICNTHLLHIMDGSGEPAIFFGKLYKEEPKGKTVAYNKPKCYRSAVLTMPYDYPVFILFDRVEPFDSAKSKDASIPGWYFLVTGNVIPLNGGGWISHAAFSVFKTERHPFRNHTDGSCFAKFTK